MTAPSRVSSLWIPLCGVPALMLERTLFGPLTVMRSTPDLLLVGLLFFTPRCPTYGLAVGGFMLGLLRDLTAATRPGTYALAYLLGALAARELQNAIRLPSGPPQAGLAGLIALQVGMLAAVLGWLIHPSMALGSALAAALLSACYTALVALPGLHALELAANR